MLHPSSQLEMNAFPKTLRVHSCSQTLRVTVFKMADRVNKVLYELD